MPRASRNFVSGLIWHITHRCHKKEFLLKFRRDKLRWIHWALQAKGRYGLVVLNFIITSNHIHLLGLSGRREDRCIARSIQLIQSRVAQEFNGRKDRHGAFWEDRYHATAIESGTQLANCLTYIDMNMVRAGVVRHPREWAYCGYSELVRARSFAPAPAAGPAAEPVPPGAGIPQSTGRPRIELVDTDVLRSVVGAKSIDDLREMRTVWIDLAIRKGRLEREALWTESVAVGSQEYLRRVQGQLGGKLKDVEIVSIGDLCSLRRVRKGLPCVLPGENEEKVPEGEAELLVKL